MTVAELIELLNTMPADAEVLHLNTDNEYGTTHSRPTVDLERRSGFASDTRQFVVFSNY